MVNTFGTMGIGLVLGWSALFLHGWSWRTAVARLLLLAALVAALIAVALPLAGLTGLLVGALAHAMFGFHLEGRYAR